MDSDGNTEIKNVQIHITAQLHDKNVHSWSGTLKDRMKPGDAFSIWRAIEIVGTDVTQSSGYYLHMYLTGTIINRKGKQEEIKSLPIDVSLKILDLSVTFDMVYDSPEDVPDATDDGKETQINWATVEDTDKAEKTDGNGGKANEAKSDNADEADGGDVADKADEGGKADGSNVSDKTDAADKAVDGDKADEDDKTNEGGKTDDGGKTDGTDVTDGGDASHKNDEGDHSDKNDKGIETSGAPEAGQGACAITWIDIGDSAAALTLCAAHGTVAKAAGEFVAEGKAASDDEAIMVAWQTAGALWQAAADSEYDAWLAATLELGRPLIEAEREQFSAMLDAHEAAMAEDSLAAAQWRCAQSLRSCAEIICTECAG